MYVSASTLLTLAMCLASVAAVPPNMYPGPVNGTAPSGYTVPAPPASGTPSAPAVVQRRQYGPAPPVPTGYAPPASVPTGYSPEAYRKHQEELAQAAQHEAVNAAKNSYRKRQYYPAAPGPAAPWNGTDVPAPPPAAAGSGIPSYAEPMAEAAKAAQAAKEFYGYGHGKRQYAPVPAPIPAPAPAPVPSAVPTGYAPDAYRKEAELARQDAVNAAKNSYGKRQYVPAPPAAAAPAAPWNATDFPAAPAAATGTGSGVPAYAKQMAQAQKLQNDALKAAENSYGKRQYAAPVAPAAWSTGPAVRPPAAVVPDAAAPTESAPVPVGTAPPAAGWQDQMSKETHNYYAPGGYRKRQAGGYFPAPAAPWNATGAPLIPAPAPAPTGYTPEAYHAHQEQLAHQAAEHAPKQAVDAAPAQAYAKRHQLGEGKPKWLIPAQKNATAPPSPTGVAAPSGFATSTRPAFA